MINPMAFTLDPLKKCLQYKKISILDPLFAQISMLDPFSAPIDNFAEGVPGVGDQWSLLSRANLSLAKLQLNFHSGSVNSLRPSDAYMCQKK